VPLEEEIRIINSYARFCRITFSQAMEQLYYMSYEDAKEFLGES
jgi:hypothetical protein